MQFKAHQTILFFFFLTWKKQLLREMESTAKKQPKKKNSDPRHTKSEIRSARLARPSSAQTAPRPRLVCKILSEKSPFAGDYWRVAKRIRQINNVPEPGPVTGVERDKEEEEDEDEAEQVENGSANMNSQSSSKLAMVPSCQIRLLRSPRNRFGSCLPRRTNNVI
jgi:hypothetical protein